MSAGKIRFPSSESSHRSPIRPSYNSRSHQWPVAATAFAKTGCLHEHDGFSLYGFVVLENHVHFVSAAEHHSDCIKRFKSFTARRIIDYLQEKRVSLLLRQLAYYKRSHKRASEYQLWQEGSHPEEILHERMMREKLDYIHNNPVKRG